VIGSMNLQEVQAVTGGVLSGSDAVFSSVSIDSRTLQPGDLFIALTGPNFNGNTFIAAAAEKNAGAAIVSEDTHSTLPTLQVEDTRLALGSIGALNRSRSTACVIALTGSQGKTTVKEMTAAILSECGQVMMTQGNLNNDLGAPLTLSQINKEHEYAVIELGANGPGEIAYTVGLTQPRIGHITNIAGTHLEGFGDLNGVARAKAELWQGIQEGGVAVVNLDDAFATQFIQQIKTDSSKRQIVTISGQGNNGADYWVEDSQLNDLYSAEFSLHSPVGTNTIRLQVAGNHNISNALAAAALAMTAGAGLDQVKAGLEKFTSVKGRQCIVSGLNDSTVIDDSYNASPASFYAAIDVLVNAEGPSIVVMGDMGELGSEAETAHQEVGSYAQQQGVDHFIGVGELSRLAVSAFGENGLFLEDRSSFLNVITPLLHKSVTVLVKGSRSQAMEKLVEQIRAGDK